MRYEIVTKANLSIGMAAVEIFIHQEELLARCIRVRPDGRMIHEPSDPNPQTSLIAAFRVAIHASSIKGRVFVVLAEDAYWPAIFPAPKDNRK